MGKNGDPGSTQSASKVLVLLRHVGMHNAQGVRLTDLISLSGFDRSTTHRLLGCLAEEGFVERIPDTKRYRLGLESMQLGLMAADTASVVDLFYPLIQRLARKTGDTVFLMVRSGDHALCVRREEGSFPVRALLVEPGMRRLLGLSTVGVSMLAALSDLDAAAVYQRNKADYARQGVAWDGLQALIQATREAGFAEQSFFMQQVYGVGCSVQISATVHAGVSIAAIQARMAPARRRELGQMVQGELAPLVWTATRAAPARPAAAMPGDAEAQAGA